MRKTRLERRRPLAYVHVGQLKARARTRVCTLAVALTRQAIKADDARNRRRVNSGRVTADKTRPPALERSLSQLASAGD